MTFIETLVFEYLMHKVCSIHCNYFAKKNCSKCRPHIVTRNLRKYLALNGLFGSTHFGPKKYTFIDTYCQQVIVVDSFLKKSFFFFGPCQPHKFEIENFFQLTSSVLLRVISG